MSTRWVATAAILMIGAVDLGSAAAQEGETPQAAPVLTPDNLFNRVSALEAQVGRLGGATPLVGSRQGGFYASYENVIVKPFFSRDDVAGSTNFGPTLDKGYGFSWDMKYSPRVELGYLSEPGGIGFRARYWNFDQSANRTVSDPAGLNVILQGDPTIAVTGAPAIVAQHSLRVSTLDFEAMTRVKNFLFSGGVRIAEVQNHYQAWGMEDIGDGFFALAAVRSNQDFTGVGPTAAVEFRQPLGSLPLNFFVSARGSAVYGNRNVRMTQLVEPFGVGPQSIRGTNDLVPIGELQLGMESYLEVYRDHFFFLKVAAEAQSWFGAGTGYIHNNTYDTGEGRIGDPSNANMGFVGLVISTGFLW